MKLHEWLETQPKEIQEEFADMERKQKIIDSREIPVSQIFFGSEPINTDGITDLMNDTSCLTEQQKRVMDLYFVGGNTQEECGDIMGVSQQAITEHIRLIRKKVEKIVKK